MLTSALASAPSAVFGADLSGPREMTPAAFRAKSPVHRNFYVRGDAGVGRYSIGSISQEDLAANGGSFISQSLADTMIISAGIGTQVSPRFRLDLTGEYRSTSQLRAMDNVTAELIGPDGSLQANTIYEGNLASYVGLLNAYVDLFNWRGFTPYVGGGLGFAHHKTTGFTTSSSSTFIDATTGIPTIQLTRGIASPHSQTNFAWALMAGTSYDLSANAKLDLGYRYINLGSGIAVSTGLIDCTCGTTGQPLKLSDISAHELRIGIRWSFGAEPSSSEYRPLK